MEVVAFLQQCLVSILIAYLSFTNMLAERIDSLFTDTTQREVISAPTEVSTENETTQSTPSNELVALSRTFAAQTAIPRVLHENSAFQAAALTASEQGVPTSDPDFSEVRIQEALVNIVCQYKTEDYIRTTTGTGFFIDEKGVILTNAHVAQFLLLKEVDTTVKEVECVIRTGDPATPRYIADLLYVSPTWIFENANLIDDESPQGTGENDFALLYITKSSDDSELPESFPSLSFHTELLARSMSGGNILSAGYPAEKLGRDGAKAKLVPVVAKTTLEELYTFGSNYADIFSISESAVGEQGTSGGPVIDQEKGVIGLIVTKGDEDTEGSRSLRALTLSYIDRTITEETGYSLLQNTRGNLPHRGKVFKEALVPFLAHLLEVEL